MEEIKTVMKNKSLFIKLGIGFAILLLSLWLNPFSNNRPTERTVVTQSNGNQFTRMKPGIFYAGFFADKYEWPNQIGVQYNAPTADLTLKDNTIDIGATKVSFLGGPSATVQGIVQFSLPNDDSLMLEIHNQHRTVEGLVKLRLAPYTQECLKASAQLMTPEMHYNGGASQMGNEYLDQLRNGVFLLESRKITTYDSIEKTYKADYDVVKQVGKDKITPLRKPSSVAKYGIIIGDGQITGTEYEQRILSMLGKQIDAQSATQLAKQQFIKATQEALTAKAQGEKKLVEVEYAKKVEQTNIIVAAETKVKQAEIYKLEQKAASEAAEYAARKVRIDADAEAYKNRQLVSAGLTPWDKADFALQERKAYYDALGKITLPINYFAGGNGNTQNDLVNALLVSKLATGDK